MNPDSSAVLSNYELSSEQIDKAGRYLAETRSAVLEATAGLSQSQWTFKPAVERWSIAEIMEHLVLIEEAIHGIVLKMPDYPEPPPGWEQAKMDELIPATIPHRSTRVKGPEFLEPTGRWEGEGAVRLFLKAREESIGLLSGSALRGHVRPHPIFGPWDGYQWLLSVAAHSARHAGQIREVKATPGFPV